MLLDLLGLLFRRRRRPRRRISVTLARASHAGLTLEKASHSIELS